MKNLVLRLQPPGTFMTLADYLALLPTPKVVELKENERVRVARLRRVGTLTSQFRRQVSNRLRTPVRLSDRPGVCNPDPFPHI
jgi:hypothetical protein